MIHPYLQNDQNAHLGSARALAAGVVSETAATVDESGQFPAASLEAIAKAGLFGLCVPAEFGGAGQTMRDFAAVVEELATACPSTAMIYVMHVTAAQAIASSATLDGRSGILHEIAAGRHLTTLAFSETGSRSHTVYAAGGSDPIRVARGHDAFRELLVAMHEGRTRRLRSAGFTAEQAATLSDLHTPNFM